MKLTPMSFAEYRERAQDLHNAPQSGHELHASYKRYVELVRSVNEASKPQSSRFWARLQKFFWK